MKIDAHVHVSNDVFMKFLVEQNIEAIINVSTLEEYEYIKPYLYYKNIHYSAGIHPWSADKVSWETIEPILNECKMIGEIGMDNVWCKLSLEKQKEVFVRQLEYASKTKKSVILHTKGQEKEILECIRKYPNTYLVHWYSCMEYLEDYMNLGCYFTVGPDLNDPAVQQVVEKVDLNHLLIESDGLSAIAWAKGKDKITLKEYYETLQKSICYIASVKKKMKFDVEIALYNNLYEFMRKKI